MSDNLSLRTQLVQLGYSEERFLDVVALWNATLQIEALKPENSGLLMTTTETAKFLGLSTKTFTNQLLPQYPDFPRIKVGSIFRFNRLEVTKWIERTSASFMDNLNSWADVLDV